jgi:hypothetical protein
MAMSLDEKVKKFVAARDDLKLVETIVKVIGLILADSYFRKNFLRDPKETTLDKFGVGFLKMM